MAKTSASAADAAPAPVRRATSGKEDPMLAAIAKSYVSDTRVTAGKLFASYGLKVDGRIFAMVVDGALVVKLAKTRVDELLSAGAGTRFDLGHGRIMKEWLVFAGPRAKWAGLVREAYTFVGQR